MAHPDDSEEFDDLEERAHKALSRHLRSERRRLEIKQADLAAKTGIHVTTLSRIEQGRLRMSLDQVLRIAAALDVDPGDFLNAAQQRAQGINGPDGGTQGQGLGQ